MTDSQTLVPIDYRLTSGEISARPPRNKGRRYPADPPRPEEIVAVMRAAGGGRHGLRLRGSRSYGDRVSG